MEDNKTQQGAPVEPPVNEAAPAAAEKQLAEKDARIAALEAALDEAKTAAENAAKEFAAQLAEKDAAAAKLNKELTVARADFAAWRAEEEKKAAAARAVAEAEFATKLAQKDARIAELEAAAKTAEQIAAEKYGAGAPERVPASPAGEPGALRERARAALGNPGELAKLAKELSPEQIRGL